ncbi:BTAD domain-containing putative transcriptional regulator [Pseudonocardia sp. H11422]|uniref:BTAD domain-containing putative transcriptional regulator n=1 Tax=Pseudonocardia sp. H11422 TaxID=2835866 RepID=UPI001BDC4B4A|nr:BTAD domain-containing putative transcriptional regulator [Pseudonocardia sp. H11422]
MGASDAAASVRVEVLGPLRLVVDGAAVEVPGPKRRAVLALLALAEGRTVTVDHLVDALWPSEMPESGRQALHTHVSRLRTCLGPAATRLQTRRDGYRLELAAADLDVAQARALLATARGDTRRDPTGALPLLREAHALWRGPVLADLTDIAPIAVAVEGCAQLHREVTDALISCAIDAGQADDVDGLAAAAHTADPLREPAVVQLMRALAATGRAAEALRLGREYRHRLADEAGLDPSPALGELERDIAGGAAGPAPAPAEARARPTTRLIGREAQAAALHRLLATERLVTLVGAGGVGKTRVALQVAKRDGAANVLLLAPVTDPAAIPHALAAALNLNVVQGDVLAACVAVLGDRPGLLVIDNCEHLLDAVRDTVEVVVSSCPRLAVLATSREPLGLAAEYAFRLAPLPLPGPDQVLSEVPSVAVFLDRAGRVRPGPPPTPTDLRLIADIVRRLDGMPLAIELAAGRLSTFSLDDLHRRLDRSLDLLGGGRPSSDARHRTLRATVEWSYQLLTEDERRLFRHLSVFVDGVDLDTAERLAADLGLDSDPGPVLSRLVDASMIDADFEGGTRYRMLETLRAFGLDRLTAAGEDDDAAGRMLRWAVELTAWIEAGMVTQREPEADAVLRRELANLRAAWRLARRRGVLDDAAAMVTALFDAVAYRDLVEIRGWAEELADDPALATHPRAAGVLGTAAEAAYHRGDYPKADRLARAGLERSIDDAGSWYCLSPLSVADLARGAYADVVEHSLAAAALASRPRENLGIAALAAAYAGDPDEARTLNDRGLAGAVSPTMRSWGAYVAGEIESSAGRSEPAEQHYVRAIDLARTSGATFLVGVATVGLLAVRATAGRVHDALRGYREVIDYFARTGNWTHQWVTLRNLAGLLRTLGDNEPAALLDAAADQAPDAPATDRSPDTEPPPHTTPATPIPSRAAVLEVARQAIERKLTRA